MLRPRSWNPSGAHGHQFQCSPDREVGVVTDIHHCPQVSLEGVWSWLWGPFCLSVRVHLDFFAYIYIIWHGPCPLLPEFLQPTNVPGVSLSSRDCLGLSAPSPEALTELELRQAGQRALGHGAPGKPSSAPLTPRAAQSPPGTRHS